jgi:Fe-S cluster assembly protein SufD
MPTARDEDWRYTALDRVLGGELPAPSPSPGVATIDRDLLVTAGDHGGARHGLVDGVLVPDLSDLAALPAGVRLQWRPDRGPAPGARYDGFQAWNRLANAHTGEIHVGPGVVVPTPIHIVHVATAGVSHPRTVIRVEHDGDATVIETHLGASGAALTNAVTAVALDRGARLRQHKVVLGPEGATHVASATHRVQRDAELVVSTVLTGVAVARNAIDVVLAGDGASVDLRGLDLPVGEQHHDTVVTVEHAASHGRSRQLFKAAIDDRGRSSFSGRVIVAAGTVGNDADQMSRSLLLAPGAQSDARPWLEIFADDVRCTHGSSTGRLDRDALFFLRARGIPEAHARAMLVGGFVAEMTDAIEPESLRAVVAAAAGGDGARL